jgi:hypothetical protein
LLDPLMAFRVEPEFSCKSESKALESCRLLVNIKDDDAGTESGCSLEFTRVKKDRKIIRKSLRFSFSG